MKKSLFCFFASILLFLFIGGFSTIIIKILFQFMQKIFVNNFTISKTGYCFLLFLVYSFLLSYFTIRKIEKKKSDKQITYKRINCFLSLKKIRICSIIIILNGLFISSTFFCFNYITTILSSKPYQAKIINIQSKKINQTHSSNRYRSFETETILYAPVVKFQSFDGHCVQITLELYDDKIPQIGEYITVYYSSLTGKITIRSFSVYALLAGSILITCLLLLGALIILHFAIKGEFPNWAIAFWKIIKNKAFYYILTFTMLGCFYVFSYIAIQRIFHNEFKNIPNFIIGICVIFSIGCLGGVIAIFKSYFIKNKTNTSA